MVGKRQTVAQAVGKGFGRGDTMVILWYNLHSESWRYSGAIREDGMNPGSVSLFTLSKGALFFDSVFQCNMAA